MRRRVELSSTLMAFNDSEGPNQNMISLYSNTVGAELTREAFYRLLDLARAIGWVGTNETKGAA